jgi:hypothetical protein
MINIIKHIQKIIQPKKTHYFNTSDIKQLLFFREAILANDLKKVQELSPFFEKNIILEIGRTFVHESTWTNNIEIIKTVQDMYTIQSPFTIFGESALDTYFFYYISGIFDQFCPKIPDFLLENGHKFGRNSDTGGTILHMLVTKPTTIPIITSINYLLNTEIDTKIKNVDGETFMNVLKKNKALLLRLKKDLVLQEL